MKKELKLIFKTRKGSTTTFTLADPKPGITKGEIETAMQVVIDKNIFESVNGDLVSLVSAKIVETEEQVFDYSK